MAEHVRVVADLCSRCGSRDLTPERKSTLIADWSCRFNLPACKIADLVKQLMGHRFCPATSLACQQRCSEAIASTFEAIGSQSQLEHWRGADET